MRDAGKTEKPTQDTQETKTMIPQEIQHALDKKESTTSANAVFIMLLTLATCASFLANKIIQCIQEADIRITALENKLGIEQKGGK